MSAIRKMTQQMRKVIELRWGEALLAIVITYVIWMNVKAALFEDKLIEILAFIPVAIAIYFVLNLTLRKMR